MASLQLWLALFGLAYIAVCLYWARAAASRNATPASYFDAGHDLPPWICALALAGASISGWAALGFAELIGQNGFAAAGLLQAGIVLPLAGVLFFKGQWIVARRFGATTQPALLRLYYGSDYLAVCSAVIAVLFAVGFAGMQLRAIAYLLSNLSGGAVSPFIVLVMLALILLGYCVIGGLRAVGFLSVLQTVLLGLGVAGLTALTLVDTGGFAALNSSLAALAQADDGVRARLFEIAGVVQFTGGIAPRDAVAPGWSALMSLTFAAALMGVQASPMATRIVTAARAPSAIAAGQTWVMAGAFGGLTVIGIAVVGAGGLVAAGQGGVVLSLLDGFAAQSPWIVGGLAVCLLAGVQLVAGLALMTAAQCLVTDIYGPCFARSLDEPGQKLLGRVVLGLLLLATIVWAAIGPVSLSALGALALPMAFQLSVPLLGLCWFRRITREAAACGLTFGCTAVFFTETAGLGVLSWLGLDLPWGRWPWTIHSAGWGMAFNLLAVILVSAATYRRARSPLQEEIGRYLAANAGARPRSRILKPSAWSAVLAWLFFALGPGLIFGNFAFGSAADGLDGWLLGMPSLWAWALLFWGLGVFLIWFLSYRLELATAPAKTIAARAASPVFPVDTTGIERERLHNLVAVIVALAALSAALTWTFG